MFLLKNPWSHLRWRGNWSELDSRQITKWFNSERMVNEKQKKQCVNPGNFEITITHKPEDRKMYDILNNDFVDRRHFYY